MDSDIPVIDLSSYLSHQDQNVCKQVAACVQDLGVVVVRDERIRAGQPAEMRNLFERYFREMPNTLKCLHERPDLHHQLGWTPSFTEGARPRVEERQRIPFEHQPYPHIPKDPKERFSIPIGPAPENTEFPEYNQKDGILPPCFPTWHLLTSEWGNLTVQCVMDVVRMASIGMGCQDPDVFTKRLMYGPHLLAPTGCNLRAYGKAGTVHAAFHTDMSFATIHGRSNYPGLYIWTRDLRKIQVRLPDDDCLLIQVGKQWQYCTGGAALAGFHEVAGTRETEEAALQHGEKAWRVSLTTFCHFGSDQWLKPYDIFSTAETREKYSPIQAGARIRKQLTRSGLAPTG